MTLQGWFRSFTYRNLASLCKNSALPLALPYDNAGELLAHCAAAQGHIYDVMLANEAAWRPEHDKRAIVEYLDVDAGMGAARLCPH